MAGTCTADDADITLAFGDKADSSAPTAAAVPTPVAAVGPLITRESSADAAVAIVKVRIFVFISSNKPPLKMQ